LLGKRIGVKLCGVGITPYNHLEDQKTVPLSLKKKRLLSLTVEEKNSKSHLLLVKGK